MALADTSRRMGFGSIRKRFSTPTAAWNAVVDLRAAGGDARIIRSISYSYSVSNPATGAVIRTGRLFVALGSFGATQINPEDIGSVLPDSIEQVLFDVSPTEKQGHFYFGESGLVLPGVSDAIVVLTAPICDVDVFPVLTDTIGSLNVQGSTVSDKKDPFGKLR